MHLDQIILNTIKIVLGIAIGAIAAIFIAVSAAAVIMSIITLMMAISH